MLLATHIRRAHLPYVLGIAGLALAAGIALALFQ
ncbi:hypothetical protein HNP52_001420 [Sphingomonas kyeonggiensis]|uniref:Uncharacterized protein n=1 Tax=Sphingomonas kyeonggiensis TaxID=1268553 RepID=A0A7W7NS77_9SPHN|nr:hypothetical protein [Sphingomonas kyeonggiensis]